jgi:hypothetical protein
VSARSSRFDLAQEADFDLGALRVSPSACRVFAEGREIRVEAQTMAVLVVLARASGATVSRDKLVESCWQGRIVSDDAITRTIGKVRALARGLATSSFTLETLPKVGYRLTPGAGAPFLASVDAAASTASHVLAAEPAVDMKRLSWAPLLMVAGVIALGVGGIALTRGPAVNQPAAETRLASALPAAAEVAEALVLLDLGRVQDYLDRGWDPTWKFDAEGNGPLHTMFMACERNPGHNQLMVAQIARMLVTAGTDPVQRNTWDDSPMDTAISPRYCGPTHPVTEYLKSIAPPVEIYRVYERACAEAFGGRTTQADWSNSGLTREACAEAAKLYLAPLRDTADD